MNNLPSVSRRFLGQWRREERWLERLCNGGLLLVALVLFLSNLGNLPLGDGEESTLARMGQEMARNLFPSLSDRHWLEPQSIARHLVLMLDSFWWQETVSKLQQFPHWLQGWQPTLWGESVSQPPLIPWLMAASYGLGGVSEQATRLPIAFLTALSVPLLYQVAKELFRQRLTALYAGLIYLTSVGVLWWGRLGSSYGVVLLATILLMGETLRVRRNLKAALGVGLSLSLLGLSQPFLMFLLMATAIAFLSWDTPRLLRSGLFWWGLILGLMPSLLWYGGYSYSHHQSFWQSLGPIAGLAKSLPWIQIIGLYVLQLLQHSLPWLIFAGYGLAIALRSLTWSWARFLTIFGFGYLGLVVLLPSHWEIALIPLYPLFALAGAIALAELRHLKSEQPYPKFFFHSFFTLALISTAVTLAIYNNLPWQLFPDSKERSFLLIILVFLTFTLGMTANLLARRQRDFIPILLWGMLVSLALTIYTPFWHWPIHTNFAVKPIAKLINENVPRDESVLAVMPRSRSSLNFYSDRPVIAGSLKSAQNYWQESDHPYLLISSQTRPTLELEQEKLLGESSSGWQLLTKS